MSRLTLRLARLNSGETRMQDRSNSDVPWAPANSVRAVRIFSKNHENIRNSTVCALCNASVIDTCISDAGGNYTVPRPKKIGVTPVIFHRKRMAAVINDYKYQSVYILTEHFIF